LKKSITKKINCLAAIGLLLILCGCHQKKIDRKIERSFYYWKSVFALNNFEKQRLDSLQVKTIYIKFFDVDWNTMNSTPMPVAKLQTKNNSYNNSYLFAPTIFITNECIQKIDSTQIEKLVLDIDVLIKSIIAANGFNNIGEIQFDCDWTATTKQKYFQLLIGFKKLWANTSIPISCTIRLHQIKFIAKTGVPPVDKGLLMCYNMGNLKNIATNNSIIETEELKKYTATLTTYPLPLDVGLPLFDWKVMYRNTIYKGLIKNLPSSVFTNSFSAKNNNQFTILKDTVLQGYEFKKGDIVRDEQSDYSQLLLAANEVNKRLKNLQPRVAFYHLDSLLLKKYSSYELESIYNSFR
jgi:hypothetical protein